MDYKVIIDKIYKELENYTGQGKVIDYIPALGEVDANNFGLSLITVDGEIYSVGDYSKLFSIQSISKVFTLSLVSKMVGDDLWSQVGREPSGTAFNSLIQLEYEEGIPRNPFINAGALVVTDKLLTLYKSPSDELLNLVRFISSGADVGYNERVAKSELEVAHRNRALAHFMKSFGNIQNDVDQLLELYCHQCSIELNCEELARSFLFLANGGIDPFSGKEIISKRSAKRLNAIMLTCGLYNESGDFAYRVGLPGKSGVGGGIVALLPGKFAVAAWSPELNSNGNSYRSIEALERLTTYLGISLF